jgi:hypothetical protein
VEESGDRLRLRGVRFVEARLGTDDHLVTVDLTIGAIAQSFSGQVATALVISPTANAVLAANDTSIWRLNSSEAPIRLPKSLGAVHLVMSV